MICSTKYKFLCDISFNLIYQFTKIRLREIFEKFLFNYIESIVPLIFSFLVEKLWNEKKMYLRCKTKLVCWAYVPNISLSFWWPHYCRWSEWWYFVLNVVIEQNWCLMINNIKKYYPVNIFHYYNVLMHQSSLMIRQRVCRWINTMKIRCKLAYNWTQCIVNKLISNCKENHLRCSFIILLYIYIISQQWPSRFIL